MRDAVAAMMVAGPVEVVDGEVWCWMRAEGIWGAAEKLSKSEEPEVRRIMLKWFGHKVVWGGVDKGNGAVEEGSIPVTHGDSIGICRDSTIQEQLKSRFESRQGSRLGGGRRETVGKQLKSFEIG